MSFLNKLSATIPIIQAPMAGISTPEMAAAVANAGGIGSIGIGNVETDDARRMIQAVRRLTDRPFNVNVFCHRPAVADPTKEAAWLKFLEPHFALFNVKPPAHLRESYPSFLANESTLEMLLDERPAIVSFHFGLPSPNAIAALKDAGITLFATATNLAEGELIQAAGCDAIVAQGYEAGGHRGRFDSVGRDERLGTFALTRVLALRLSLPVIAAGGIMDAAGAAAALNLGAAAVQLGTAFLLCPESAADEGYRRKLRSDAAHHTVMTTAISGRPARSLPNDLTRLGETIAAQEIPDYPIAYDATKSLNAAAKGKGNFEYGPHWAGQGAPLIQEMPAAELVKRIADDLKRT